jgi:glycosyltransferase involved in cell wall biosynthesis
MPDDPYDERTCGRQIRGGEFMRVGYDEQVLLAQTRGGISRYIVHLVESFQSESDLDVDPVLGWRWTPNAHAAEAGMGSPVPAFNRTGRFEQLGLGAYYLANTRRRRQARRADVLHHTYYHPRFLAPGFPGLRVTTVHDMIPELYPESFTTRDPHLSKAAYVAASDLVLCVSESTRRDLIEVYGDPGVPMPVTYLGVDPAFQPDLPRPSDLPERYVLFIGRRSGYKDFDVLLQAWAEVPDDGTALVVVGGGPLDESELARLRELRVEERTRHIEATDAQLRHIYAGALVFVFPSRHEGFGLPTLEAMASGLPVVLAHSSSHPEVGGDVARYFAPGDVGALTTSLLELLGDQELRAELGWAGVARARTFTWQDTARATSQAYHAASLGR